jgi:outer membrane protein
MRQFLVFVLTMCCVISVQAEKEPKMELGVAIASQYLADYRGSKETQVQAIPVPILLYRGEFLKIDRRGVRGDIFTTPRWEFNLSGEASLNGGSDDNELREGMPELDSAFEFGPSLNVHLLGDSMQDGLSLRLPVRAVFGVDTDGVDYIGYLANPKLTLRRENIGAGFRFSANLGAVYGSEDFHDYYYSVSAKYVTEQRPFYQAESGASGWYFKTGLSKRVDSWWFGASLRYDNLSGAVFSDSPLVETNHYYALSFAVAKFFWHKD